MVKEVLVCGVDFGARDTVSIGVFSRFNGLRLIETATMVENYEDWSAVRSPGRARRRRAKGHRQNIVIRLRPQSGVIQHGDTLYAHPATVMALAKAIADQHRDKFDEAVAQAVMFGQSAVKTEPDGNLTVEKIRSAMELLMPQGQSAAADCSRFLTDMDKRISRAFLIETSAGRIVA